MTAAQRLIVLWEQRDALYRTRRVQGQPHPLSEREAEEVRHNRRREILTLPEKQRAKAIAELDAWRPPEVSDGQ